MMILRHLCLIGAPLLLSAATTLPAQEAVDLARGFDLLVQAGLPDTKGWTYVSLNASFGGSHDALEGMQPAAPHEGQGWIQAKPGPDGLVRVVAYSANMGVLIVQDGSRTDEELTKEWSKLTAQGLSPIVANPKPVNEQKDAEGLAKWLVETLANAERKQRLLYNSRAVRQLFYCACHYYRRGLTKEGEQMARSLLEGLPRREQLLHLALGDLASARAAAAMARLRTSLDWKGLETELTKLLADFPVGWRERALAERLLGQIKSRAAGEALKPFAGHFSLTPEQQAWWDKLVSFKLDPETSFHARSAGMGWLGRQLDPTSNANTDAAELAGYLDTEPWKAGKDWDWITVMAAALGDETPVPAGVAADLQGMGSSFRYDSDPFGEDEPLDLRGVELESAWREWPRPPTRGEIAEEFLAAVLPAAEDEDGGSRSTPPAQRATRLRAAVKEWNQVRAGKTGLELARLYLEKGNAEQQQAAATLLITKGNEADASAMEEALLAAPEESTELAQLLLQRRKAAGKPFWEKYKAALIAAWKENYGGDEEDEKKREALIPDYAKQQLTVFENLVSGRGVADMIEDFVSGKIEEDVLRNTVGMAMQDGGSWSDDDSKAMLAAVGRIPAQEGLRKFTLLNLFGQLYLYKLRQEKSPPSANSTPAALPAWILEGLRALLEKDGNVSVESWDGTSAPLRNYIYMILDQMWDPEGNQELMGALRSLPAEDYWPVVEARAKARLAEQPLPPTPSAANVSESRRAEIVARAKAPGQDWDNFVKGLKVEEKILLAEALRKIEVTPEWRAQMLKISGLRTSGAADAKRDVWQSLVGQSANAQSIQAALAGCQQVSAAGTPDLRGWLRVQPMHGGMNLHINEDTSRLSRSMDIAGWLKKSRLQADTDPPFLAVSVVSWNDKQQRQNVLWQLGAEGKWTPLNPNELSEDWKRHMRMGGASSPEEFSKLFDKWTQEWNPNAEAWHVEFGVWHVPPKEVK